MHTSPSPTGKRDSGCQGEGRRLISLGIAYFDPLTPGPSPGGRGEQKQWLARCVHTLAPRERANAVELSAKSPSPGGRGEQKQWLARCVHTLAPREWANAVELSAKSPSPPGRGVGVRGVESVATPLYPSLRHSRLGAGCYCSMLQDGRSHSQRSERDSATRIPLCFKRAILL